MMTTLEWREAGDTYRCDGYRIDRSCDSNADWYLTVEYTPQAPLLERRYRRISRFGSLRSARAAALHLEIVRVRRIKLVRHLTLAIFLMAMSIGSYLTMNSAPLSRRIEWFFIAMIAVVLALSEGLDAFVLLVSDGWDHKYEVPRVTYVDRIVAKIVLGTTVSRNSDATPQESKVRTLPLH